MNLLDTNVLSHLQKNDPIGDAIATVMATSPDQDFRTTTVNAYEMLDGAFGVIHERQKLRKDMIPGFQLLQDLLDYLALWRGASFGMMMHPTKCTAGSSPASDKS